MSDNRKKAVAALSGGVDSSTAAALALEAGYEVVGATLRLRHPDPEFSAAQVCASKNDEAAVEQVCRTLEIAHRYLDEYPAFEAEILRPAAEEYAAGRTPNPCCRCNPGIKFGKLIEFARSIGAERIITGHYAKLSRRPDGVCELRRGDDRRKDQSYFLYMLGQRALSKAMFPVGHLTKAQVREIAADAGLVTSGKKDSTGVCFIGERNFRAFLSQYLPNKPGKILTLQGEEVGEHIGLMHYTLGQRRGVNLGGKQGESGRWFVVKKDVKNNILYVSHGDESPLYTPCCEVQNLNWIGYMPPSTPFACRAKFRYRQSEQDVTVTLTEKGAHVDFAVPQRAVTPGQYAVFYDDTRCLGGGVIV